MYHVISGVRRSDRLSKLLSMGVGESEKMKPHIYLSSGQIGPKRWVSNNPGGIVGLLLHLDKTHPLTKSTGNAPAVV